MNILNNILSHKNNIDFVADFLHEKYIFTYNMKFF